LMRQIDWSRPVGPAHKPYPCAMPKPPPDAPNVWNGCKFRLCSNFF